MSINYEESNVIQLLKSLKDDESMKNAIERSLANAGATLSKADIFTRIFQKKSIQLLKENMERCERDINDYNSRIYETREKIEKLGYTSKELKNIEDALNPRSDFFYNLKQDHPWIKLLDKSEQDSLFIEAATDRYEGYSSLMSLTSYIDSFKTNAEKLDFIHGFMPDFKTEEKQTDAYKIGVLFYGTGSTYNIDLEEALREYAPHYRNDLKFVLLVNDLQYEKERLYITVENLKNSLIFPNMNEEYNEAFEEQMKTLEQNAAQKLKTIEDRISIIQKEIELHEFFGKIEFLGRDSQGNTIVGEALYYNNYKNYKKEIDESRDCGRPIAACSISKEEYHLKGKSRCIKKNNNRSKELERLEIRNTAKNSDKKLNSHKKVRLSH